MLNWRFWAVIAATSVCAGTAAQGRATLKDAYHDDFRIGVAINSPQITGQDSRGDAIIGAQFNSITPENVLKWEVVHPKPDVYDFSQSDQYVAFGEKHHMTIVGHVLVWHSQTPAWVFRDDKGNFLDREALLKRMRDHIATVVGRYKGRIQAWDVVNEAVNEDGAMRQSPWQKIIGDDYVEKAFQYAHDADPHAELIYNDYNLENPVKRKGALALVAKLIAEGIPVACVGLQGHDSLDWPSLENQGATISAFGKLGVKVAITELDIDLLPPATEHETADVSVHAEQDPKLNPYPKGLPEPVQQKLATRYADLFRVFLAHRDVVERVTFWGLSDGDSWRNDWPVLGRTSYPLLYDRNDQPKPAFYALLQAAASTPAKPLEIAFTWDDLPAHSALPAGETRVEIAQKLIAAMSAAHLPPAYGFVNGVQTEREPLSTPVLQMWRDAGLPLGNHTWSHPNLNTNPLADWEADVLKNEPLLEKYMGSSDWRWLRYPFLGEGETAEKRLAERKFLAERGYRISAVTMSFADYAYNEPYARCVAANDTAAVARLEESYLSAAGKAVDYSREMAKALYGHDIPYVLLMHIGAFDARMLPQLLKLYIDRGFSFVTLKQAESDPFYRNDLDLSLSPVPDTLEEAMRVRGLPIPAGPNPGLDLGAICR